MTNSASHEPILITKLKIPRIQGDILIRQRLLDMLAAGTERKLTLITAPAGFGKTTLAYDWIRQLDCAVAWLSLDDGDNDPKRFWNYVLAALQSILPDFAEGAREALINPLLNQEVGLTILINELAELEQDISLILDDFHLVEHEAIHHSVRFLVDNIPPQLRLIISSRVEPNLPLARMRARRELVEVTASDLRLTATEVSEFFNAMMQFDLSEANLAALEARTEGWIAGLQMVALSMQGHDDLDNFIAAFTGSHHHILDYLVEEVLEKQAPHIQDFLLQTSVLDSLNASLCDAVTQGTDSQAILDRLSQGNLFISALDDERKWYRYHQLFAEFLRNRLQQKDRALITELHLRAANWFNQQERIPEAIEQLIAGEQFEDAADFIEEHGAQIFWRYHEWVRLHRWLDALPRHLVYGRPILCAAYAWAHVLTGHPDKMAFYLEVGEQALSPDDNHDTIGEIITLKAENAMLQGRFQDALDLASEALTYLSEDNIIIRSLSVQIQGYIYRNMGNVKEASRNLSEAYRLSLRSGNLMIGVFARSDLGVVKILQGRLNEAHDIFEKILHDETGKYSSPPISAYIGLGDIARERNEVEQSLAYLQQGIELAEQYGVSTLTRHGNMLLAYSYLAHGDIEEAKQACDIAVASAHRSGLERIITQSRAHEMNLNIRQNNLAYAEDWVLSRNLSLETPVTYSREMELVVYARLMIAKAQYEDAIALLTKIISNAEKDERMGNVIEDLVLLALATCKNGDDSQALVHLERAIELAASENYLRVFVEGGDDIARLLRLLAGNSRYVNYISRILDAHDDTPSTTVRIEGERIEELSERELEVLRLLAVGMSNREIAEQLIIGSSTVKTHTLNIYRKLYVNNRTHAVTRARSLNLI